MECDYGERVHEHNIALLVNEFPEAKEEYVTRVYNIYRQAIEKDAKVLDYLSILCYKSAKDHLKMGLGQEYEHT